MVKYLSIYNNEECPIITSNSKNFEFIEVVDGKNISGENDKLLFPFDYKSEIIGVQMLSSAKITDTYVGENGLLLRLSRLEVDSNHVNANTIKTNIYRFGTSKKNTESVGLQVFAEDGSVIYNSSNRQLKIIDNIKLYRDKNYRYILPFKRKRYPVDVAIFPVYMPLLFISGLDVEHWAIEYTYSEISVWMSDTKTVCLNEKKVKELVELDAIDKKKYKPDGIPVGVTANILVFDVSGLK